jgi:putative sigma-54 modulation protein
MQVSVTFRQLEPSEALKSYVTDRLKKFKRYLDGPLEAHVVLGLEKFRHLADITINSNGHVVKGREENADMYAAIDLVMDKIDMQLRKHRGKLREVKADRTARTTAAAVEAEETRPRTPIRRVKVEVPPLDLNDAVELLQTKGNTILVFTDVNTGALSILYRRTDGGLGLAEPELG